MMGWMYIFLCVCKSSKKSIHFSSFCWLEQCSSTITITYYDTATELSNQKVNCRFCRLFRCSCPQGIACLKLNDADWRKPTSLYRLFLYQTTTGSQLLSKEGLNLPELFKNRLEGFISLNWLWPNNISELYYLQWLIRTLQFTQT